MPLGGSRTVGLDPTTSGFCFVVVEGSETLVDWQASELSARTPQEVRRRLGRLVKRYEPDLLVVEDMESSRRGRWARQFVTVVTRFAAEEGIAIRAVSRQEVREHFRPSGATKYEIAVAITRLFPELASRLPRKRKPWMSEDERMSIFDALSFVLIALRRL